MSTHALTRHPTPSFKAQSHAAVNNPDLRQSFGGAMDFLQAKRAAGLQGGGFVADHRP